MNVNNRNRSRRPPPEVAQHMKQMQQEHEASLARQIAQKLDPQAATANSDPEPEEEKQP